MLTKEPLKNLMQECAEMHKRYDTTNREQARFQIASVAQALINRRVYKRDYSK